MDETEKISDFIGKKKALFIAKKMKSELVHNMAIAEGTSLTFIDTKTIIDDKIAPGGKNIDDIDQVIRLGKGWDAIINQVLDETFNLSKENFIKINAIVARNEALEIGGFRKGQVYIGDYTPPYHKELDKCFKKMIASIRGQNDISRKASDLFLDSARNQYFYDGNKRTAQLIMNGLLISKGFAPRSIQRENLPEYNERMAKFYHSNDKKEMYDFLEKSLARIDIKSNISKLSELEH